MEQRQTADVRISPDPGLRHRIIQIPAGGSWTAAKLSPGQLGLLFCRGGRLELAFADGRSEALGPGDLLVQTEAADALQSSAPLGAVSCVEMAVTEEALAQLYSRLALPPAEPAQLRRQTERGWLVLRDTAWSGPVLEALEQIPQEEQGGYVLLRALERLYFQCRKPAEAHAGAVYHDRYQREASERVRDYMVSHLDCRLTVEALAKRFQLSATSLKACFRHVYGEPPHTYLQRYRLEKAAELLRSTDMSVLDIAAAVGYSGTSRFGAAFRELYRMTPGAYRRSRRKKNVQNR